MSTPGGQAAILESLNSAQRRAVTSDESTVAILAGPGSGKTHTLTSRVVWNIQQLGYRPSDVIVATFTVKAAREMKERIGKTLGEGCEKKIVLGTFHSIARRYLALYGKHIGLDSKFGIADDDDTKGILQRICKRRDLNAMSDRAVKSWISKKKAKGSLDDPSRRGIQQTESPRLRAELEQCYQEYQDHLSRSNLLDYDDLLVRCVELLRHYPGCVSNVQAVLIDEYQDTNGIQYELMKLFAQFRERITVVGDPDQSIYGWRSAEVRNLYRLLREYPRTDEISLEENYRSSQSILDVSLNVIQQDKERYQKVLVPVHTKGTRPVLRKLKSAAAEGEWIVSEIKRVVMMFGGMLKYEDIAILLRSASLSRHTEAALGRAGIGYRMVGGHKFYARKEIQVLLDYLRVIYQPGNNDAVARIVNIPRRGIGRNTINSLLEEADRKKAPLWLLLSEHCRGGRQASTNIKSGMKLKLNLNFLRTISNLQQKVQQMTESSPFTLVDLLEQLISQLRFKEYLQSEYGHDHEQRWANVQEFVSLAADFMRGFGKVDELAIPEVPEVEQAQDGDVLGRFLANIALASDAQKDDQEQDKSSLVTISTIHAAKGLEWPVVFVPSVYAGSIPHARSEDLDEERRLLYVAMTRAQALLYVSCPLYGSQEPGGKVELSPFVSPFASTAFAPKGPSLDRPIVESAAKILGREALSENDIFDKMPPMFSPEDDLFPVEPLDPKAQSDIEGAQGGRFERGRKRQRMAPNGYGDHTGEDEAQWEREYSTTMEKSLEFTVPSLPGFVSAGEHQSALAAAAVKQTEEVENVKLAARKSSTRRPAGQKSLLGFFNKSSKTEEEAPEDEDEQELPGAGGQGVVSQHSTPFMAAAAEQPKPAMNPLFAQHRLATGQTQMRPSVPKVDDVPKKQYAAFSSSPPRPASHEEPRRKEEEQQTVPHRPAASFHATTFMATRPDAGFRRPVGLGPPPAMDRLQAPFKPFKPLTIKRGPPA